MNKNKQIVEQLAKDIRFNRQILTNTKEGADHQLARLLVNDGYCKASDVARDIMAKVYDALESHSWEDIAELLEELETKYKGDGK